MLYYIRTYLRLQNLYVSYICVLADFVDVCLQIL